MLFCIGSSIVGLFNFYLIELTTSPPLPIILPASGPVTIVLRVIVTLGLSSSMSDILARFPSTLKKKKHHQHLLLCRLWFILFINCSGDSTLLCPLKLSCMLGALASSFYGWRQSLKFSNDKLRTRQSRRLLHTTCRHSDT